MSNLIILLTDAECGAEEITVLYTNYGGETAKRRIRPIRLMWASTEHHLKPQWILTARDLDRNVVRNFALKDMMPLREAQEPDNEDHD